MKTRQLGNSGLVVLPLMLGGNVFGWTLDERASFKLLDAFVGAGFNFIDTSDVYSKWAPGNKGGESETIIGNWFKRSGRRKDVILATKVGIEMGPDKRGLSRAYILRAVEDSLKRLRTDYIDLYQSHRDDPDTPQEETMETYAQLIKAGKVRAIGASNFTADRLAAALQISRQHGWPRYESLQPYYNLAERADYEAGLERVCRENNLGVIPYYSLASGFLSGKYRSEEDLKKSARGPGVKKYLNERGFKILKTLDEVASQCHSTPAAVSLAWLMARPGITAPIASATSMEQFNDLVAATRLTLGQSAIELLNKASAPLAASV